VRSAVSTTRIMAATSSPRIWPGWVPATARGSGPRSATWRRVSCAGALSLRCGRRVTLARYAAEDPTRVTDQLHMAATLVGETLGGIDDAGWRRECIYNFPAPARRSVAWLGAHTLHEGEHHLGDLDRAIAAVG